jgi:tetrahydromethanopterin S-methyltransferase subunit G
MNEVNDNRYKSIISEEQRERVRKIVKVSGHALYLSPDKEVGAFLFFMLGDDIPAVALKTAVPEDVIVATAIQYKWEEKKSALKLGEGDAVNQIQKQMINMILAATFVSVQSQLSEVLSGKKLAKDCGLIPGTVMGLERLLEMVALVNGAKVAQPEGTNIHAQNVQIVNNPVAPQIPEQLITQDDIEKTKQRKAEMLEALASSVK